MKLLVFLLGLTLFSCTLFRGNAWADGSGDPAAVKEVNGEWYDKDGNQPFTSDPMARWTGTHFPVTCVITLFVLFVTDLMVLDRVTRPI